MFTEQNSMLCEGCLCKTKLQNYSFDWRYIPKLEVDLCDDCWDIVRPNGKNPVGVLTAERHDALDGICYHVEKYNTEIKIQNGTFYCETEKDAQDAVNYYWNHFDITDIDYRPTEDGRWVIFQSA